MSETKTDFERGYSAGWDANNRYRQERHDLLSATSAPTSSLLLGVMLAIFGGLFAVADFMQWYRWHEWEFWPLFLAAAPLIGSFFALRSIPKLRQKAREEANEFKKWH